MSVGVEYLAPKLRILRSRSIEEDIRLLVGEASHGPERFLAAVRGTRLAAKLPSTPSLEDVERAAWSLYLEALAKLPEAASIVPATYAAYSLAGIAPLLTRLIARVLRGEEAGRPEEYAVHPLLAAAAKAAAEHGVRGLAPFFRAAGLSTLAQFFLQPRPSVEEALLYTDLELVEAFSKAYTELGGEIGSVHVCYRLDALIVRSAANAIKLDSREAKGILAKTQPCIISSTRLVEALEESSVDRLGQAIHGTPYAQYTIPGLGLADAVYHAARRLSRQKLGQSLAYDPTEPGMIAAVLELLLLDAEDVAALATAAYAGLSRETVSAIISVA